MGQGGVTLYCAARQAVASAGIVHVLVASFLIACKAAEAPEEVLRGELASVDITPDKAPADGATLVTVTATLAAEDRVRDPTQVQGTAFVRTVTFTSSGGVFTTTGTGAAAVPVNNAGQAIVTLRAPRERGRVDVFATGRQVQLRDTITFVDALPSSMTLEASDFVARAAPTSVITLRAVLRRDTGFVAKGLVVSLSDRTPNDALPSGLFSAATPTDADGVVTAKYTPGCRAPLGRRILTATFTDSSTKKSVSASTTIEVLAADSATTAQCNATTR